MNNIHTIITERVDDIPLVLAQMQRMSLPALLDAHFPTHGNWQGLSLGWVTVIWRSSILSEGDHRLHHVEPWGTTGDGPCGAARDSRCRSWISLMTGSRWSCPCCVTIRGGWRSNRG